MPHIYNAPNLPTPKHAFFGRTGGVSKGIYNSLNFNYRGDDKPENLERTLDIVGAYYGLPGKRVVRLCQAHTSRAVYLAKPSQYEMAADGAVTDKTGIVLGITTADCIPVLMADFKNGIIGFFKLILPSTNNIFTTHFSESENSADKYQYCKNYKSCYYNC